MSGRGVETGGHVSRLPAPPKPVARGTLHTGSRRGPCGGRRKEGADQKAALNIVPSKFGDEGPGLGSPARIRDLAKQITAMSDRRDGVKGVFASCGLLDARTPGTTVQVATTPVPQRSLPPCGGGNQGPLKRAC